MHAPGTRLRLPRAVAVTCTMLSLAAGAHTAAGGTLPPAPILLALSALTMLAVVVLTGRRRSTPAVAAMLAGGQFILHQALTTLSPGAHCAGPSGHLHHLDSLQLTCAGAGHSMASMAGGASLAMFAAHAVATIGTALALAKGEAAFWTMAAWLRPLLGPTTAVCHPPRIRLHPCPRVGPAIAHRHGIRLPALRGPPPATVHA